MVYRVIWSSKSVEDVDAIATYIVRDSPSYAAAVVHKILETTRQLAQDPKGVPITESHDGKLQEKLAYTYRIIYRFTDDTVTILAIVHPKRLTAFDSKG
jgi:plasmid stabilization system protein ParE